MLSFSHTAVTKVTISKRKTHTNTSTFECSIGNVGLYRYAFKTTTVQIAVQKLNSVLNAICVKITTEA